MHQETKTDTSTLLPQSSKRHYLTKIASSVIKILYFICVLIFIGLIGLYVRLLWKPIALDFIEPYIKDYALDKDYIDLKFHQPQLTLSNNTFKTVVLKFDKIDIFTKKNNHHHFLDDVQMSFSKTALLLGKIKPKEITIEKLSSNAVFNQEFFDNVLPKSNTSFSVKTLTELYQEMMNLPVMSSLKRFSVNYSDIRFVYPSENYGEFTLDNPRFLYENYWKKSHIKLGGLLKLSHLTIDKVPLQFEGTYLKNKSAIKFYTILGEQSNLSQFSYQKNIHGWLYAKITGALNNRFKLFDFNPEIIGKNITFKNKTTSLTIKDGHIHAHYNQQTKGLDFIIKKLNTNKGDFNGTATLMKSGNFTTYLHGQNIPTSQSKKHIIHKATIAATGRYLDNAYQKNKHHFIVSDIRAKILDTITITGKANVILGENIDYNTDLKISKISLPELKALWPSSMANGAREWISDNIFKATFDDASLSLASRPHHDIPQISLSLPVKDASFFYLHPMTPAENVNGIITIKEKTFNIAVSSGKINRLKVHDASFSIADIFAKTPIGKADAHISGDVKPLLSIIDQKPLELMHKNRFDYAHTQGQFNGTIQLSLPLLKDVKLEQVALKAKTRVKQGSLIVGRHKLPVEKVDAVLNFTEKNAFGSGEMSLFDIKSQFDWKEDFNLRSAVTTDLSLNFTTTEDKIQKILHRFDIQSSKFKDYFKGLSDIQAHLQLGQSDIKLLSVKGNLDKVALGEQQAFWSLPQNTNKTITLEAYQKNDNFIIKDILFKSPDGFAKISDMVIDKRGIARANIKHLSFKQTIKNGFGHYHYDTTTNKHMLQLKSSLLSVKELLDFNKNRPEEISFSKPAHEYPNILASFNTLLFEIDDETQVKDVSFVVVRHGENPHKLKINLSSKEIAEAEMIVHSMPSESQSIELTCIDAGNFLKGFGYFNDYQGGKMIANLTRTPMMMHGNVVVKGGALRNAPWVAKLFSLASFAGIMDRLASNGLSIDKFTFSFHKNAERMVIKNGSVHGSAIGLSFQGIHHFDTDALDFYGTAIPVYGVNSIFSELPLIGKIVSSRKGEGIIGVGYKITGDTKNPDVFVNPLSILTPGITRRIFE